MLPAMSLERLSCRYRAFAGEVQMNQEEQSSPRQIELQNGSRVEEFQVAAIMVSLRSLFDRRPIAFYELVMLARDPKHVIFGNNGEELVRSGLLDSNHQMHDVIRNIVLSATEGDGVDMILRSPRASARY